LICIISFGNIVLMIPQLNLLHLKYFCDAVVNKSISEAAKLNFVSQSAVSQAISKLEISLGVRVVLHTRQKFQVTEEGMIVFEQARHVFKAIQDIQEKIHLNHDVVTGSINFVSTHSLGMSVIPKTYQKMRSSYPHVEISYRCGNLNFIRNALRQGEAEFAIVVYDQDFAQFEKHPLKKGCFHLYQNKEAPLTLLEVGILVDSSTGMHVESLRDWFFHSGRAELKIQTQLSGWEVVARFTEMNIGIGFFPDYIVEHNRYPHLQLFPIDLPAFEYEICAIHNKGEKLSRAACAFLDQFSVG